MKKFLLITAMCLFSIILIKAQSSNFQIQTNNGNTRNPLQKPSVVKENFKHQNKLDLQKNKSIVWNWDTIVTYSAQDSLSFLFSRTYDNTGNILTDGRSLWKNNAWKKEQENAYIYNNGRIIISTSKSWFNNLLSDYKQDSNFYNSTGNLISKITRDLLINAYYSRYSCSYNTNGKKLVELYENYQNNVWVNSTRITYTYDSDNNNLSQTKESWANSSWNYYKRYTYTYDTNGNMLSETGENWINSSWVNSSKSTYTYDLSHNLLTDSIQYWATSTNSWKYLERNFYTYNSSGVLQTILNDLWYNNAWLTHVKTSNSYNQSGDLISITDENWQDTIWVNFYKQSYNYDINGNSIYGKQEQWDNNNWVFCLYSGLNIFTKNEIYNPSTIPAYYKAHFISFTTGINENRTDSRLKIFPNPATTQATITYTQLNQTSHLRIYNMLGQLVYEEKLQKGSEQTLIDTRTYKKGLYKLVVGERSSSLLIQ